ncbi:unnamed protein product [Nippostrongylus brasiliensis]|uniref:ARF7EP_C domain-containing protein n=1 Tax=Nippostrongylus brasiliensis TaxID=27835 RepID=A0A0N4YVQ5_NIPBR|nr:unnamed protein product [Nippostrongylus brasiliensis]
MSSTNDALSYLVGLANAKASAMSSGPSEDDPSSHHGGQEAGSANLVYFDETYDDELMSQEEIKDKESMQEKRQIFHDKKGKLIVPGEESITLCDCLIPECHGCHWPCASCGGRLCGPICQQNRKKFVSSVTVMGVTPEIVTRNPCVPNKFS